MYQQLLKNLKPKNPEQILQKPAIVKSGSNADISNVKNIEAEF